MSYYLTFTVAAVSAVVALAVYLVALRRFQGEREARIPRASA